MPGIETFKERLQTLVAKFQKDSHHYLSRGYSEAQVRIDFINPFFDALGWDIENRAQRPPHERDVLVELSPEATGRPDYNFRLNGVTKFFVEAKAPSVALNDTNHILQAKTYAWSTKEVYFVVLTDFEEFRLYDASLRPNPKYPNEGLIFALKYTDYVQNIDKLWELSRERVEQGSLEALLPKDTKSKRLRIPPDKSFLKDLTQWRTELAKDIYKRNSELKIKVLDPACGSGSFLLGAYQYLIDYHVKYYREHRKEAQSLHLFPYWEFSPDEFSLPLREKAKILRNNIFGVDIDPQAVEITMMSLYLKALEGERGLLPRKQHLQQ